MKKISLIFGLLLFAASAQAVDFKDVPTGHWASDAVNELVRLGITSGYPDGTFRGNKNITRYEACVLLSQFASIIGVREEKIVRELKTELKLIKHKRQQQAKVGGSADLRLLFTNTQPEADYRLKAFYKKKGFTLLLDTLDAGFGTSQSRDFMDFLSLEFDNGKFYAAAGPGDILHLDPNIPSEDKGQFPKDLFGLSSAFQGAGDRA